MGRSNFMLQFMLDTSLSDAEKFPFKMADLIVTSVNPNTALTASSVLRPLKRHQRPTDCRTSWRLFLRANAHPKENGILTKRQSAVLTRR
ncbi:MAG: hypothetical protein CM15mV135_290 [uncultured marine virus]|nr:MAG: hypothetical protein CM15mV135_290 [uncultured marine virus]